MERRRDLVEGPIAPAPDVKVKGGEPVSVRLRLDDDSTLEVAAVSSDLLRGPFDALQVKAREPAP